MRFRFELRAPLKKEKKKVQFTWVFKKEKKKEKKVKLNFVFRITLILIKEFSSRQTFLPLFRLNYFVFSEGSKETNLEK